MFRDCGFVPVGEKMMMMIDDDDDDDDDDADDDKFIPVLSHLESFRGVVKFISRIS